MEDKRLANERTVRMEEMKNGATRYAKKAFPNDRNGDKLDKGKRDY